MRQLKFNISYEVGVLALILVFGLFKIQSVSAQAQGFVEKNTSLINQFESALNSEHVDSAYTLGFKLADQFSSQGQFDSTTMVYNKVAKKALSLNADSLHFTAKHAESYIYMLTGQNEKCEKICQYIISQNETKYVPKSNVGSAYHMIGFIRQQEARYDESNRNLDKCLSIYKQTNDTLGIGESLRVISINFEKKSEPGKAISYLLEAISYLEAMDSYLVINMYYNVLNLFLDKKNIYKAKEYISKIEELKGELPNEMQFYIYQILKARILNADKKYKESDELINSSLNYFTLKNKNLHKRNCFLHLANSKLRTNEVNQAKSYVDSLKHYKKYIRSKKEMFSYYLVQSKLSFKQNLLPIAEMYIDSAKHSINEFRDIREMHKYHHVLYQIYKQKDQKNLALEQLEKYKVLDDSIYTLNQNMLVTEIEAKYIKDQQDKKIISLNNEKKSSLRQIKQHRMSLQLSILGLIILGMIAFYIYKLNKKLKSKNKDLKTAHSEKDFLLREIHHRVKNNLQVISSLLALQSKYIKDDNALSAIKQGQDRVYSMALIHQDLYQSNNLKGVNSKDYFEQLIDNLFDSYNINEDKIELNYDVDAIVLDVETMIPLGLVMNELVSNALKHAFKDQKLGKINVDLKRSEDYLTLKVSDNGNGLKDIVDLNGKSFGYELIKAFARKLKADINIESENGLSIELKIKNYTTAA